jgi:hypothetical protein
MNEFWSFDENSVLALIAMLPRLGIWGCSIVALDYWVWAGRSSSPPAPPGAIGSQGENCEAARE